jgi:hypothetical protein
MEAPTEADSFWFDILGKLFSIRGAGEKPTKPAT